MSLDRLANAGMLPSSLALGCEPLGGTDWGHTDIGQTRRAVRRAIDLGVTSFDTADIYGLGRSEEELGRALGPDRHQAFIITKFGLRWRGGPLGGRRASTWRDGGSKYLSLALENSLRRLRVDTIALYLLHWPDPAVPLDETLEGLQRAQEEGKVLNYGVSNFGVEAFLGRSPGVQVSAVEAPFSLLDESSSEALFVAAAERGVARIAYGTLAQGLLTGKYAEDTVFASNDRRTRLSHFGAGGWDKHSCLLRKLRSVASQYGRSMAQTAVRWTLDSSLVDMAVVGAKTPEQMEANVGSLGWSLDHADVVRLGGNDFPPPT
jgi:aryl-alcohol dehydrogenase-like predicted oxidoreductase